MPKNVCMPVTTSAQAHQKNKPVTHCHPTTTPLHCTHLHPIPSPCHHHHHHATMAPCHPRHGAAAMPHPPPIHIQSHTHTQHTVYISWGGFFFFFFFFGHSCQCRCRRRSWVLDTLKAVRPSLRSSAHARRRHLWGRANRWVRQRGPDGNIPVRQEICRRQTNA